MFVLKHAVVQQTVIVAFQTLFAPRTYLHILMYLVKNNGANLDGCCESDLKNLRVLSRRAAHT